MNVSKKLFSFNKREVAFFFGNARIKKLAHGLKLYTLRSQASWQSIAPLQPTDATPRYGKLLIITPGRSGNACERHLFRRRVKSISYEEKLYLIPAVSAVYSYKEGVACDFLTLKEFLVQTISACGDKN